MPLNAKQARFVEEYLVDLNATQAAIRAGYSEASAHAQGHRLLKDAEVAEAIAAAQQKRAEKVGLSAEKVLAELQDIGFGKVEIDVDAEGVPVVPLRYEHKLKALELLGKHLALFTEKHEHSGTGGQPLSIVIQKFTEEEGE